MIKTKLIPASTPPETDQFGHSRYVLCYESASDIPVAGFFDANKNSWQSHRWPYSLTPQYWCEIPEVEA